MFQNYLKVALRNFVRHKSFSLLNVLGLSLGIASAILILLWVRDERSYDQFHKNGKQLFSVFAIANFGEPSPTESTPAPLAEALVKEFPEVEQSSHMSTTVVEDLFTVADRRFKETNGRYVSNSLFQVFTFPFVAGDPQTALLAPNAIVLSESTAKKYFNTAQAVGKSIETKTLGTLVVTGVMKDIPPQSSIHFDFALPFTAFEAKNPWTKQWGNIVVLTTVKLKEGTNTDAFASKIENLVTSKAADAKIELFLEPFTRQYLYSNLQTGAVNDGRIEYVRLFTLIGFFVLLIACINFMNLATARSEKRSREVGVRKVIGATRMQLALQFLAETMVMVAIAVLLALVIVKALLPIVNVFTGKQIGFNVFQPSTWSILLLVTALTGTIAGSYPAFFLSSFKPIQVLKGTLKSDLSTLFIRKGLVVFQFTLTLVFVIASYVIYRQILYVKNTNLGLDRENLLTLKLDGDLKKNHAIFLNELSNSTAIKAVTQQRGLPVENNTSMGRLKWGGLKEADPAQVQAMTIGYNYLRTMNLQLLAGRDFSKDFGDEAGNYLVNESAVRLMGMENPIGETIEFWGSPGKIIGVVKDYHSRSLYNSIMPQVFVLAPAATDEVLVRTEPGKTETALQILEKLVKKYNPDYPFEYQFVDEAYQKLYESETLVSALAYYFAVLTIVISCLGLFGLTAFTAEQRTKEIGIRKILGASVTGIIGLLSRDFVKLVLISILIATPIGYYAMHKWLDNFAYKIDLDVWVFLAAGTIILLITILTISYQAIKAAVANPVTSLRTE
jgi:predicted permease